MVLTGEESVPLALAQLGMLVRPDEEFEILGDDVWLRGGAETYLLHFAVRTQSATRRYLLKACTPAVGAVSLEQIFGAWLQRRRLIDDAGLSTPHLFGVGSAVLLEEYIDLHLRDALSSEKARAALLSQIGLLVGTLDRLGFSPISLFDDLRSRGTDVVVVDFGSDLGAAETKSRMGPELLEMALATLENWKLCLSEVEKALIESTFFRGQGRIPL